MGSRWESAFAASQFIGRANVERVPQMPTGKRIGRNRELAHALWKTYVCDASTIPLLVDDRVI